jgi:pimeloyl-ACP methyl ester carboxylesterase
MTIVRLDIARPQRKRIHLLAAGAALFAGLGSHGGARAGALVTRSVRSGYATVDGLRIYYELHGGSPASGKVPIVLMHGGAMAIQTAFGTDLLPRLARIRPVVAIEQQGHGHTGDREGPITIDRMVDDTAAVLAHLGVKQAHFVGHSLGGILALGVAIRHAALVKTITPISAFYTVEGMQPELAKLQRDPTLQPSAELLPLLPTEAMFARWSAHFKRYNPNPSSFETVLAKLNTMLAQWQGWTPDQLSAIEAPTLVVIGDNDYTRIEHAADMVRLIPRAQLAVLPNTTHLNIVDRGAWLVPLIVSRIT